MKIQLDSAALTALISDDPIVKLELQRAVVAEVGRKTFLRDLGEILPLVEASLVKELVAAAKLDKEMMHKFEEALRGAIIKYENSGWSSRATLTAEQKSLIQGAVDTAIGNHRQSLMARLEERLEEVVKPYIDRFEERLPVLLDECIDRAIQSRIDQGVSDRLALLKAAI